nr:MAG TPA: hypothetical protein [Caudoviricetes sp.]
MNIAEILQHCPKGMALYSPLFGEVKLKEASPQSGIIVEKTDEDGVKYSYTFSTKGVFLSVRGAECLLFPSDSQRDWTSFRLPVKNGNIMMTIDDSRAFIVKGEKGGRISVYCGIDIADCLRISDKLLDWTAKPYIPASDEAKEVLFNRLSEKGYKWNPDKLCLEKICQFKPFDKVLVRDNENMKWNCSLFSFYKDDCLFPFSCIDTYHNYCIPYEGNEHLLGTTNSPEQV